MAYPKLTVTSAATADILREIVDSTTLIITDDHDYAGIPAGTLVVRVTDQKAKHIADVKASYTFSKVVAIGGCTALDFGRACAVNKTLIVLPAILSNACLSTNRSVINYNGKYRAEVTTAPSRTIVCLPDVMQRHAAEDAKWTPSGFGDLLSAVSAAIEFEYAENDHQLTGIRDDQIIRHIPLCWEALQWAAGQSTGPRLLSTEGFIKLSHYLHESSLDVIRNGHTRLNAASEHTLYYFLQEQQRYSKGQPTHGQLVSIGTLLTTKLYGLETGNSLLHKLIRAAHHSVGLPLSYDDLAHIGVTRPHLIQALDAIQSKADCLYGHYFRKNYSLLDQVFG